MIDKIFSFIIFFVFLFLLLTQIKIDLLNKQIKEEENLKKILTQEILINKTKYNIYNCYEVVEKEDIKIIKNLRDNFNPKINGFTIITEPIICDIDLIDNKTTINFSFQ